MAENRSILLLHGVQSSQLTWAHPRTPAASMASGRAQPWPCHRCATRHHLRSRGLDHRDYLDLQQHLSVFWIILLHGWNNTIQSYLVLSAGFLANVIALLPWAVAIYLLRKYGRETLIRNQDRTDAAAGSAAGVIRAAGADR